MSKNTRKYAFPKYRFHKASGRGVIQFRPLYGKNPMYLPGAYNSQESRDAYLSRCNEIEAYRAGKCDAPLPSDTVLKIATLQRRYLEHCRKYYGAGSRSEYRNMLAALVPLRAFGRLEAKRFGPLKLAALQQKMIGLDWSRTHINASIHRVRRMFAWGVQQEVISAAQLHQLREVPALRKGKTEARETNVVAPVDWEHVEAVLPYLDAQRSAMVQIHWLCGMRSGELTRMRGDLIEPYKGIHIYVPQKHKTKHLGKMKVIAIGPKAWELAKPFTRVPPSVYYFRPALSAPGCRTIKIRDRYSTSSYQHAILHGFTALAKSRGATIPKPKDKPWREWLAQYGITYWHPHQLRHARSTLTREKYGKEGSEAQLGNGPEATSIYALPSLPLAVKIAIETG